VTVAATGSVTAIQGKVVILRGSNQLAGVYGTPVQVGDRVTTAAGSQVTITLDDGTQLELAESSTLTIIANRLNASGQRAETRVDLLGGLLHSLVRFAPGNAPNYEVHTPNAVAAARGTSYDTQYSKGVPNDKYPGCLEFTNVSVFDGTVEVTNPTNPSSPPAYVKPGQKVIVPCGAAVAMAGVGTGVGTTALVVGGVIVGAAGAGVGGAAAAGAFSGGSSGNPPQKSVTESR
jgi:ferric-dicitrate binding protein FerR (iron transport regulator)